MNSRDWTECVLWGMLHEFVTRHREEIIRRCRAKVATRSIPPPTDAEIDHGVPAFLEQLVVVLRLKTLSGPEIRRTALRHGHDLLLQGFTLSQVVHDYGDVCQSITDLAVELAVPITSDDFRILNACLDDAIAVAVTEYARERDQSARESESVVHRSAIDGASAQHRAEMDRQATHGSVRLGYLAHELRNLLNTALLASEALASGRVGVAGSTSAVLRRSLLAAVHVVTGAVTEVRETTADLRRVPVLVTSLLEELEPAAALTARAQGVVLTVDAVEPGVAVEGDRQILAAVVMNLLQNAFKFTRPHSRVVLRVGANAERVILEVQDECGGLPAGDVAGLFLPLEQRNADRSGLGLGLAFSQWAVEAHHGRIYARDLPGEGCIFTVDLPRVQTPELAGV